MLSWLDSPLILGNEGRAGLMKADAVPKTSRNNLKFAAMLQFCKLVDWPLSLSCASLYRDNIRIMVLSMARNGDRVH